MLQKYILEQPGAFNYFFESHPDGICIVDVEGQILNVNASTLNMFGFTREELLKISLDRLLDWPGDNNNFDETVEAPFKVAIQHKKGHFIYVRLTSIPLISDGKEMGKFITFEDITQYLERNKKLLNIQEMFTFISKKSQNIISSFSADGIYTYVSPNVKTLMGYTPEEVIGKPALAFGHPDDNEKLRDVRNSVYIDQDTVRFTGRVRHKNGDYRWYETTVEFIRDQFGEITQKICVGRDVTDRKEQEETIAHLAYHDPLTGLPNRRLFNEYVMKLLENSQRKLHGLMLLDLDGFKDVNDTFGHEIGDQLLIEVARRLMHAIGDQGLVARWGGDEFTVIHSSIQNRLDSISIMERIKELISEPIIIDGHTLDITASIGLSFSLESGDTIEALLKKADAAMYRIKKTEIKAF